jgi:hypothetical protein
MAVECREQHDPPGLVFRDSLVQVCQAEKEVSVAGQVLRCPVVGRWPFPNPSYRKSRFSGLRKDLLIAASANPSVRWTLLGVIQRLARVVGKTYFQEQALPR